MKSRTVRSLRAVLTSCLVWTGGAILMRLQVFPGIRFWHNFALIGLLVIPVFMYAFLFSFLEITEHDALIYIYGVLTVALVLGNAWSSTLVPAPEAVTRADGTCVYVYHATVGIWVLVALEILVLVYATYLAHCKIGGGICSCGRSCSHCYWEPCLFWPEICSVRFPAVFPFDMLGCVGMAVCMVYIMYKQYLFDFSYRVTVGAVYFLAVVVASLPLVNPVS